jgi:peptidoglycan-associated lipoprotein
MKTNKMIFPVMIALVAVVAVTGCKKGPTKITQLPGDRGAQVGNPNENGTLAAGNTIDTSGGGTGMTSQNTSTAGHIETTSDWDPANMIQDRATFASDTVHFAFDSSAIISKEASKVIIVSEGLKADMNAKLLIEGHCDERGTEEYNRALGERRALALREELVKDGVSPDRIRTISYGKDKPIDDAHDEAAWSKNRRGEFILCHPKM